jgi:hypothetical protein
VLSFRLVERVADFLVNEFHAAREVLDDWVQLNACGQVGTLKSVLEVGHVDELRQLFSFRREAHLDNGLECEARGCFGLCL